VTRILGLWLAALLGAATSPRSAAAADPPRVVYLGDDAELTRALEVALGPWGVVVVTTADPPPRDLPAAGELAAVVDADAMVWTATVAGVPTLHVYDETVRQLVVRPLAAAPPFDAPTAAAVALTVKTVLRLGRVAPVEERVDETHVATGPPRPAAVALRWRVETALGSRLADGDAELRSTVGLVWSPRGGRLGVGVGLALGPGVAVDVPEFAGRHTGTSIVAAARWRVPLGAVFLEPAAGLSLTRATLDGVAVAGDVRAHVVRYNPGGVAQLALGARTANLELAIVGGAGVAFRRQRFLLGGMPLYEVPALDWHIGLRLSVIIP
jgi:hypothetical protein